MQEECTITGTLVWYYFICKREVWLLSRQICADQQDANMDWGRYLHEHTYQREKKEISAQHNKFDFIDNQEGELVVVEVKKTDKFKKSATMQLLYYLYSLQQEGVAARGELRFPEQKKIEKVSLSPEATAELLQALEDIRQIVGLAKPPKVKETKYCKTCAYGELCWA